ncbi:hypothetical protein KFE25_014356 [Diacronema lutheri]|uniref:F-box domain-containing protein n=1 Tax=Diacronema lutheri TaxID=2081491 RepID=A0A8J5XAE6_DIALT|nr:hypothetical protein KFE25_014356 [Diacronema lutheri]
MEPREAEAKLRGALSNLHDASAAALGLGEERRLRLLINALRAQLDALACQRDGAGCAAASGEADERLTLLKLPPELIVHVLSFIEAPADFARISRVCWQLHGAPAPPVFSPVERAIRERAARRGLHPLPSRLAPHTRSWTETLLRAERERLAICHCAPLSAAVAHAAAINEAEHLVTFGVLEPNGDFTGVELDDEETTGLLGTGMRRMDDGEVIQPTVVRGLSNVCVRTVSAGRAHTLVVSSRGRLYSFGHGADGKLGHGDLRMRPAPKLVQALEHVCIVGAAAGSAHSLALSDDGRVFAFGRALSVGLGVARGDGSAAGSIEQAIAAACRKVLEPEHVRALGAERVCSVSTRGAFSIALTHGGSVWSWGCANEHGELGRIVAPCTRGAGAHGACSPAELAAASICALRVERAAYTSAGDIAAGVADAAPHPGPFCAGGFFTPQRIDALNGVHVESVSAGVAFGAAVASDGRLFTWGDNSDGQLGHGDLCARALPTVVSALAGTRVLRAEAGATSCLALSAARDVYSWGHAGEAHADGAHVQLTHWLSGHGSRNGCREPRVLRELSPAALRASERAAWLAVGCAASFVGTDSGRVFAWGDLDYAGFTEDAEGAAVVPPDIDEEEMLAQLLAALSAQRIRVGSRTYLLRPEPFAHSELRVPPMGAMVNLHERPVVPPRTPSAPAAGGAAGSPRATTGGGGGGSRRQAAAQRSAVLI